MRLLLTSDMEPERIYDWGDENMASPQLEDGFIGFARELWDEIIRRDFTKRQKDILEFLWRFSYGCRKKTAIVPKLKDFGMCGVAGNKATDELNYLVDCRVITWNRDTNHFGFIKDFDQWQVSPVKGFDRNRFNELLRLNLTNPDEAQNGNKPPEMGDNLPNQEETSQKVSGAILPKRDEKEAENPCGSKDEGTPKDSSLKTINNVVVSKTAIQEVDEYYVMKRGKGFGISPEDMEDIVELLNKGIPVEFIKKCIDQAFIEFKPKYHGDKINTFKYCTSVVKGEWSKSQSREKGETHGTTTPGIKQNTGTHTDFNSLFVHE